MEECPVHPVTQPGVSCMNCSYIQSKRHPRACDESECMLCSMRDCPRHCPDHYHHDGCPSCDI